MPTPNYVAPNPSSLKKWIWVIAIAVVVVVVFAIAYPRMQGGNTTTVLPKHQGIEKKDVDTSKLPEKFPGDIPLEEGAKVVQNYNATAPDGTIQATRMFETAKTLDENFKLYKDFFTKNGWTIVSSLDQENIKAIGATKDKTQAQLTFALNSTTKVKTVEISVTIKP